MRKPPRNSEDVLPAGKRVPVTQGNLLKRTATGVASAGRVEDNSWPPKIVHTCEAGGSCNTTLHQQHPRLMAARLRAARDIRGKQQRRDDCRGASSNLPLSTTQRAEIRNNNKCDCDRLRQ